MKVIMKAMILGMVTLGSSVVFSAGTGDPSSLKVKVYRFAVSENQDCSDPVTVVDNGNNPDYVEFLTDPTLGSGSLADGTYPCVMIEMSDHIKFTPNGTVGTDCVGGTEYTLDVCGGNGSIQTFDGNSSSCPNDQGSLDQGGTHTDTTVTLYLSTASTSSGGSANAFVPPVGSSDATRGFQLGSALVVSGNAIGVFNVNGDGKVEDKDSPDYCEFNPPVFTFVKQ